MKLKILGVFKGNCEACKFEGEINNCIDEKGVIKNVCENCLW